MVSSCFYFALFILKGQRTLVAFIYVTTCIFSFRLFQVEYAIEAVKLGSTAVGVQCSNGVILAVEKRLKSTLLEPHSVEKIMEIDSHIGVAVAGLIGGEFLFHANF